ncbi:MAG: glutamate--cysteine ligase [Gammaproteobacteria bacterium]|nr:glutamate--cysteine ligase [Gammaproteobacteria bacterium]MCI0591160.1 glutamate--cysteine ligase [Gammaproteobacteria bacterium]
MNRVLQRRLTQLVNAGQQKILKGGKKGIEKESLRITLNGEIAQTPHPVELGSALTHPYITTDYSEALLELRTPPFSNIQKSLQFLFQLHQFVYANLNNELLWATSMPCSLEKGDKSIPIAQYGSSNVGTMKHIYRRGLDCRYGRKMQAIAGAHFNYSLPVDFWHVYKEHVHDPRPLRAFVSDSYFSLVRNFQRFGWLIPYLFGCSPALCKSFLDNSPQQFPEFDDGTYFEPYATSLRMSDIGYKNKTQAKLNISYRNLEEYVESLTRAIETPYPEFERIRTIVNGEYRQLNANILQIENEYYSFIRPKQIAQSGEKPTLALKRRGVQYVETRVLDIDAFNPIGIGEETVRFLEAFLILCLLQESPYIDENEQKEINYNQEIVAKSGRDPSLKLQRGGRSVLLREWAKELCSGLRGICELLDEDEETHPHRNSVKCQLEAILDAERTPSARMLTQMRKAGQSFFDFEMRMSEMYLEYFNAHRMSDAELGHFAELSSQSVVRQREIEASDQVPFDEYLRRYFAQT